MVNIAMLKENLLTYGLLFLFLSVTAFSFYYYNLYDEQEKKSFIDYHCCYALCKDQNLVCDYVDIEINNVICKPDDDFLAKQRGKGYISKSFIYEVQNNNTCNKLTVKYGNFSNNTIKT